MSTRRTGEGGPHFEVVQKRVVGPKRLRITACGNEVINYPSISEINFVLD